MATDLSKHPKIQKLVSSPGFKKLSPEKQKATLERIVNTIPQENVGEDVTAAIVSGVSSSLPVQVGFAITNPIRQLLGQQPVKMEDLAYNPRTPAGNVAGMTANVLSEAILPGGTAIKSVKGGLNVLRTGIAAGKVGLATGATRSVLEDTNKGQVPSLTKATKQAAIEGGLSAAGGALLAKGANMLGKLARVADDPPVATTVPKAKTSARVVDDPPQSGGATTADVPAAPQPTTPEPIRLTSASESGAHLVPKADFVAKRLKADPNNTPTVPDLARWLKSQEGEPGISIEPEWIPAFGGDPGFGKNVVMRDAGGKPIGILNVGFVDETGKVVPTPQILQIAVDPAQHRKGIARQLFDAARAAGIDTEAASGLGGYTEAGAALKHRRAVEAALAEGKPVSPEVLKDYPDLVARVNQVPDPTNPQAGMAQPVDSSPILQVLEGGVKAITDTPPAASNITHLRPQASPEAVQVLGPDAANLKGTAATVVNELAPQVLDAAPPAPGGRPAATPEQIAAVKPERYVNFAKFDLSESEKAKLGELVQQAVAETGGNPKPRVTFEQIKAEAAAVDPAIVATLKPVAKGETLDPAVRLAANARLTDLTKQIAGLGDEIGKGANTLAPDDLLAKQQQLERMEMDAKGLLDVLWPARSQDGRNLAFHRIIAQQSFAPDYWMSRARKAGGGTLLSDTQARLLAILGRGNEAMQAGDEKAARAARIELAKELTKLDRSTPLEVLMALRKAGLLTGAKTHMRNMLGNTGFAALEEVSRLPSSIVDLGLSLATGKRTVAGPNLAAVARASKDAATKGAREALQVLRHGATEDDLARLDISRQINSGNKLLDGYVNGVFRFLGAQDRIFKTYALRRSLEAQASVIARNTKGAPKDLVKQLVDKPTDEMIARAIADAEFATFNQDNAVATAVSKFKSGNPALGAGADLVMPFVKTPTNVIARLLDYTGVPLAWKAPAAVTRLVRGALTEEQQRLFSEAVGRGTVGPALIVLGYQLAQAGVMTGTFQKEQGQRNLSEVANRGPSAIKVGGQWHQIGALSPIGNLLALGATMHRDAAKDGALDPATVAAIGAKTVGDQPFLQGMANVGEVASDPGKEMPKFVADVAGSFVPTIVSDVAGAFDDTQREAKGIAQGLQKRLPGLRNQLPPKVDALGREVPSDPSSAINPFLSKPAAEDTDPVVGELVRLGIGLTKPDDNLRVRRQDVKLTGDQQRELTKMVGQREREKLEKLLSRPHYQRDDDEGKRDKIEKVLQRERARARKAYGRTLK